MHWFYGEDNDSDEAPSKTSISVAALDEFVNKVCSLQMKFYFFYIIFLDVQCCFHNNALGSM